MKYILASAYNTAYTDVCQRIWNNTTYALRTHNVYELAYADVIPEVWLKIYSKLNERQ